MIKCVKYIKLIKNVPLSLLNSLLYILNFNNLSVNNKFTKNKK